MKHGDLTGAVLDGRYRVIAPVAEGAMGVVYRAERLKLGRIVAIKVLHEVLPSELRSRQRFEVEAMAMAKLEHPHCAAVLDVGIHEECPFVVMDFVSGPNLKEVIAQDGAMPPARAAEIVRQVLSGLAAAHEHGIIHRDIKPANLVLSQKAGLGDHVKILDFGLARITQDVSNLTTGIVVGTPSYMAPEQIRGTSLDCRVDLYACGVLLFELLTGKKPFVSPKDDPIEVCTMHLKQPPPRMRDVLPGVDFGELEDVVAKALSKAAADRYATAVEFAAALDAVSQRRRIATPFAGVPVEDLHSATHPGVGRVGSNPAIALPGPGRIATPPAGVPARVATPPAGVPARIATPPAGVPATEATPAAIGVMPTVPTPDAAAPAPIGHAATERVSDGLTPPGGPPGGSTVELAPSAVIEVAAQPAMASPSGLATGFDLSLAIPQAPAPADPNDRSIIASESGLAARAPSRPDLRETVAFSGAPPAGPSPLAAVNGANRSTGSSLVARRRVTKTQFLVLVVGASVCLVVLVIALALRGGGSTETTHDAAPAPPPPTPAPEVHEDPAAEAMTRLDQLLAEGNRDQALELALASRKAFPNDARFPLAAGKLYFTRLWWNEGIRYLREAIRLEPKYRSDRDLIKTVLRGFITTPRMNEEISDFLAIDIGEPSRSYLEETVRDHPSSMIKQRASAQLKRLR